MNQGDLPRTQTSPSTPSTSKRGELRRAQSAPISNAPTQSDILNQILDKQSEILLTAQCKPPQRAE